MNDKLVYLSKESSRTLRNPGSSIQVGREWGVRKLAHPCFVAVVFNTDDSPQEPNGIDGNLPKAIPGVSQLSLSVLSSQLSSSQLFNFDLREHGRSFNRAEKCLCRFPGGRGVSYPLCRAGLPPFGSPNLSLFARQSSWWLFQNVANILCY